MDVKHPTGGAGETPERTELSHAVAVVDARFRDEIADAAWRRVVRDADAVEHTIEEEEHADLSRLRAAMDLAESLRDQPPGPLTLRGREDVVRDALDYALDTARCEVADEPANRLAVACVEHLVALLDHGLEPAPTCRRGQEPSASIVEHAAGPSNDVTAGAGEIVLDRDSRRLVEYIATGLSMDLDLGDDYRAATSMLTTEGERLLRLVAALDRGVLTLDSDLVALIADEHGRWVEERDDPNVHAEDRESAAGRVAAIETILSRAGVVSAHAGHETRR